MPQKTFFSSINAYLILVVALATPATASDYAMSPVQFPSSFNVSAMNQVGKIYDQPSDRQIASLQPGAPLQATNFVYSASQSRRRANIETFIKKSSTVDPKGAAQMAQLFASTDVIVALGRDLQPYGLRTDNVADAYAVYWVQSWQAANGDTNDPSRATMQAVKRQSANALASTPEFSTANDATKQEMAEAMMVQAMLISASVDTYKDDPAMMRKLGAAVRKGAKASGLDLDTMTLTDEGFVPAKKTGAANPAPGTPETALAANASAAPAGASPPYLLIAAAGGAGLGGVFLLGRMFGRRG